MINAPHYKQNAKPKRVNLFYSISDSFNKSFIKMIFAKYYRDH